MAFHYANRIGWHEGENYMHNQLHVPYQDNPSSPFLTPSAARLLPNVPLLALSTLDKAGRPWTTLLGGEAGFVRPLGQSNIGIRILVDPKLDPVTSLLLGRENGGSGEEPYETIRPVAALGIDLETRSRVKLTGRMGAIEGLKDRTADQLVMEAQMVIKIEQSLGNCPKYLNKKRIVPTIPKPELVADALPLSNAALELLNRADLFFVSSSHGTSNMGTNHRGGPRGFIRVFKNDDSGTVLVYPEYSGNRLYQTLGNLSVTPKAGMVVPDLESGDVLYITATTEILIGKDAATLLPRSNLAVKVHIQGATFVRNGLTFRGKAGDPSPYNPPVRFLATERTAPDAQSASDRVVYAKLTKKELLTPSIGRFRFSVSDPEAAGRWKPGQYVALAFEDELGGGYSHMRDDDPSSLNDDLVRTFTVSSSTSGGLPHDEFEITIRTLGRIGSFLSRQNVRAGLEIPLKGIAGKFTIQQTDAEIAPFVAGGVGITPLLAHLPDLLERIKLFWALKIQDVGLALDTFQRYPQLASSTTLYVSGFADANIRGQKEEPEQKQGPDHQMILKLEEYGARIFPRRMLASDIQGQEDLSSTWYICAGPQMRRALLSWLSDKEVVYEDFDY
ncbi:MAG: hypothetical protein Q9174_000821 [Haloplaca sp. 1 TL-2023]